MLTTSGVSLTRPYGGPFQVSPDLTTSEFGPAAGNNKVSQPAVRLALPIPQVQRKGAHPSCPSKPQNFRHRAYTQRCLPGNHNPLLSAFTGHTFQSCVFNWPHFPRWTLAAPPA